MVPFLGLQRLFYNWESSDSYNLHHNVVFTHETTLITRTHPTHCNKNKQWLQTFSPFVPHMLLPLPHTDKHDSFTQILISSSNIFKHCFYLVLHLQQYVSLLYWCEQPHSLEWESGVCKSMALGSWHDMDLGANFSLYIADWVDHGIITEQINALPPEHSCFHWITKLTQNCNTWVLLQMPQMWFRKWFFHYSSKVTAFLYKIQLVNKLSFLKVIIAIIICMVNSKPRNLTMQSNQCWETRSEISCPVLSRQFK